jgi:hypothetical protein
VQDLSAIGPRRYESKTVPTKGVGKMKRKAPDSSVVPNVSKRTRGYVWLRGGENKRVCVGEGRGELEGMCAVERGEQGGMCG